MAEFSKIVITNKGKGLLAKILSSKGDIEFSKVCSSSHQYNLSDLEEVAYLEEVKQTSLVSKVTRKNDISIRVETAFTNAELTEGYYMRTLGLYAIDPDDGEILYAITSENSGNCYMPPHNGITVTGAYIQLVMAIENADNVSLKVDAAAIATIGDLKDLEKQIKDLKELVDNSFEELDKFSDLQDQITDLKAFIGYTESDIYGVEVDFKNNKFTRLAGAVDKNAGSDFDDIRCFGGRRRCNVTNEGKVVAYYGEAKFSATGFIRNNTKASGGIPVQTMVEQPKFYYKVVPLDIEVITDEKANNTRYLLRKARYYISDSQKAGFKLHPAFIENGNINEYIYLAAFEGSLFLGGSYEPSDGPWISVGRFDVTEDKMLSSIASVQPSSGAMQIFDRNTVRSLSRNRGAGWEQCYAATLSSSQLLMIVEYATFNMQSAIGEGAVTSTSSNNKNGSELTGATLSLGNASGYVLNDNGIQMVSYRGEENLWGNINHWIDGMNIYNPNSETCGNLYISDYKFSDDGDSISYRDTGMQLSRGNGYISAFGYSKEFDWLFVPVELNGNSNFPVGDYVLNNHTGWITPAVGGKWNSGNYSGLFNYTYQNSYSAEIGGRLVFIPSKKNFYDRTNNYGYRMLRIGTNFNLTSNSISDIKVIPFQQDLPNCNLEEDFVELLSQGTLRAKKNGHIDITMDIINFATSTSTADGLISFVLYKNKVIQGATKFQSPVKYEERYSYNTFSFTFATNVKVGDLIEIVAYAESSTNVINTNFHSNSTIALKFNKT